MDADADGESRLERARAVALRFLGYSARSSAEVRRRLERGGFDAETINAVVAEMESAGWLDDGKFARDWIEDRSDRKGYGRTRLAAELQRRGVDREVVERTADAIRPDDEFRRALAAARPRFSSEALSGQEPAAAERERRRIAGFLQRRGFDWDIIKEVIRELAENNT
jgi:regulatory protein